MKATILIDNITKGALSAEWGLSVYIEYGGHKFLLDTGASGKFSQNAEKLGCSLEQAEFGILSHAHYDHADGMAVFFERNKKAPFYLRAGSAENCYGKRWIFHKYIGIPRGSLKKYKDRIVYAEGDYEIIPGVRLLPHKPSDLKEIARRNNLYVKQNGKYLLDSFSHEQSLVLDTEKGLVIFNSCSHGGADNIINEVSEAYPAKKIYALIGGFHLFRTSEEGVRDLAERIRETGIEKIYTGHCTGESAFRVLKEELGDRVCQIYTGLEINI